MKRLLAGKTQLSHPSGETADAVMTSKLLFRLLPIQILLAAIGAVNGIVSSLFASNAVGTQAMSAVGLYNPINLFIVAISMMLVGGASILCGKYMGKNETDKMQNVFSLSILIALAVSAVFTLIILLMGIFDLSGFLTGEPAIRKLLNQYLIGQSIGVIPLVLGSLLSAFLSLENRTRRTTAASLVYILVNVLFNFLFVQVLRMEALGLSLASSLGLWIFFLIQAQYFLSGKSSFRISWKHLHWKETGSIVRIGIPGAANNGYQTIRGLIVNMLITQFVGAAGLSAFAAANTLLGLVWAIPTGMLNVSRMLISISVGEEDRQTLADTMRNAVRRFIPLMCIVCAIVIALAVPLTRLYYRDPSEPVYMMTVWGFRILPLCMPLAIFRMVLSCYGQTMDRNIMVNVLEAVDGFVSVCAFTALLIPALGMNSVYIANVLNGVVSVLYLLGYSIIRNRKFPKNMEELMVIPPDFGVSASERMDLTVRSMEEVVNISREVQEFCLEKGIEKRRSYFAGLFIEEMAGNVVSHGFIKDRRSHSADLRVVHKDGMIILRIKDDCIPFDPAERRKIFNPDDIAKNIGIRMVYSITDDISYQNILGLNVLTIRI